MNGLLSAIFGIALGAELVCLAYLLFFGNVRLKTMKAAIAIDSFKLPVFERRLTANGYSFEVGPGLSPDTLLLRVETDKEKVGALYDVCWAANGECASQSKNAGNLQSGLAAGDVIGAKQEDPPP